MWHIASHSVQSASYSPHFVRSNQPAAVWTNIRMRRYVCVCVRVMSMYGQATRVRSDNAMSIRSLFVYYTDTHSLTVFQFQTIFLHFYSFCCCYISIIVAVQFSFSLFIAHCCRSVVVYGSQIRAQCIWCRCHRSSLTLSLCIYSRLSQHTQNNTNSVDRINSTYTLRWTDNKMPFMCVLCYA